MKAKSFDQKFERQEDLTKYLELTQAKRSTRVSKRVNVDFPAWMLESLDREAARLGVTRQSIIKIWLAERLERSAPNHSPNSEVGNQSQR